MYLQLLLFLHPKEAPHELGIMFLLSFLEHSLPWYLFSPTTEAGQTTSTLSTGELFPIEVCSHNLLLQSQQNALIRISGQPLAIIQRALPLSTVWPLAATLLQKVRLILPRDFSWFPWDTEDSAGWLHCSCQCLPLTCCFLWCSSGCSSRIAGTPHWVLWHLLSIIKPESSNLAEHVPPTLNSYPQTGSKF